MRAVTFGKKGNPVIMFLHGGGLSWWNYREQARQLQKEFRVVLAILDGHGGSDRDFISVEENASELIAYIDENFGGSVVLIGGLSLGAQILVEMMSRRRDICRFAVLESACVIPAKGMSGLIKPSVEMSYGLIRREWFARAQFKSLKIRQELYADYYRDSCCITKENMISFLRASTEYVPPAALAETAATAYIFVGERESGRMIRSAKKLHRMIPGSVLQTGEGLYHGEYSLNHPKEYTQQILEIIKADICGIHTIQEA